MYPYEKKTLNPKQIHTMRVQMGQRHRISERSPEKNKIRSNAVRLLLMDEKKTSLSLKLFILSYIMKNYEKNFNVVRARSLVHSLSLFIDISCSLCGIHFHHSFRALFTLIMNIRSGASQNSTHLSHS